MINLADEMEKQLMAEKDDRDYDYNHPSEAGWVLDCMRLPVLLRTMPVIAQETSLKMKKRYAEGKKQERLMRESLEKAGFKLIHFDKSLTWDKYKIKGQPDDLIFIPGNNNKPHILEYKSCSPQMFREIRKFTSWGDFLKSKFPWLRHYPAQIMTYLPLLQANKVEVDDELEFMYFKNKDTGEEHQVNIFYDDPFTQMILKGITKVNEYVADETNEVAEYKDSCRWCDYYGYCFDKTATRRNGLVTINNEDLERKLDRLQVVKPHRTEYNKLYDEVKDEFKSMGEEMVIIGNHSLSLSSFPHTTFDVPEEIKIQYKGTAQRTRFNIKPLVKAL